MVPNQPLEIMPCHHLVCTNCVGKITEMRILTCTCSSYEISADNISIPHPIVLRLLGSLLLKCPLLCGQVVALEQLCKHLDSNCMDSDLPSLSNITVQQVLESPPGSTMERLVMGTLSSNFIPQNGSVTYKLSNGKVKTSSTVHINLYVRT